MAARVISLHMRCAPVAHCHDWFESGRYRQGGGTVKTITCAHAPRSSRACNLEDEDKKGARRERPNWGLALLMRPAKAAAVSF